MRAFLGPWSARRTGVLGRIEVTQVDAKTLAAEENLSRRLWFLLFAVYYATMARIDLLESGKCARLRRAVVVGTVV